MMPVNYAVMAADFLHLTYVLRKNKYAKDDAHFPVILISMLNFAKYEISCLFFLTFPIAYATSRLSTTQRFKCKLHTIPFKAVD